MKKLILLIALISLTANAQTYGDGLIDIDGNQYSTVIINGKEWMTTNLRKVNGLNQKTLNQPSFIATVPYYFKEGNNNDNIEIKGILYNGYVINNVNFVANCLPTAEQNQEWRIPTEVEWLALNSSQIFGNNIVLPWYCTNQTGQNNNSGLNLLPTGMVEYNNSAYEYSNNSNKGGNFWTSSVSIEQNIYKPVAVQQKCEQDDNMSFMESYSTIKDDAMAVRLVRTLTPDELSSNTFNKSKANVYPNPVQNELNIQTDEIIKNIEIFDMLGNCVHKEKHKTQNINIEHLSKGVYLIRIQTEKRIINQKIIKE